MKRLMLFLFVVSFFHTEQATAQVTGDIHQKEAIIGLWQDHSEIVGVDGKQANSGNRWYLPNSLGVISSVSATNICR